MSAPNRPVVDGLAPGVLDPEATSGAWALGGHAPEAVVAPRTADEVGEVLRAAAGRGLGVVPLGSRTSPGPEAPRGPWLALSTSRLTTVEDYEPADLTVTVGAGVTLGQLGATLGEQGQWLPADPPRAPHRTVGGLVATGRGGALSNAFGAPRDHVLGLTVVTGDARVLRLGGRVMKNVAGFDLVRLMVGSQGALGVIVSASLRLFPRPEDDRLLVLRAAHLGELLAAAARVAGAPVLPASALLVTPAPDGAGGAALVVRVLGSRPTVEAEARVLLAAELGGVETLTGDAAARFGAAVRDHVEGEEVVVRASALPSLLPQVVDGLRDALPSAALAADVMTGRVRAGGAADATEAEAVLRLRARLEAMGGSLCVERAPPGLLATVPPRGERAAERAMGAALKARFDPRGTLSPGRFEG